MPVLSVPYHLDDRLRDFDPGVPGAVEVTAELPPGDPWSRMAVLHEHVATAVFSTVTEDDTMPVVVSGDCTTSLGVLAGLRRAGGDIALVWMDAHADFHTDVSSSSGYVGGMPLAIAVGLGDTTVPDALGMRPLSASRVVLVDARDTDPDERAALSALGIITTPVRDLDRVLPPSALHLHVDIDVCDAAETADLLYPASGGPTVDEVAAAVRRVAATERLVGVSIGVTCHPPMRASHRLLVRRLADACTSILPG